MSYYVYVPLRIAICMRGTINCLNYELTCHTSHTITLLLGIRYVFTAVHKCNVNASFCFNKKLTTKLFTRFRGYSNNYLRQIAPLPTAAHYNSTKVIGLCIVLQPSIRLGESCEAKVG